MSPARDTGVDTGLDPGLDTGPNTGLDTGLRADPGSGLAMLSCIQVQRSPALIRVKSAARNMQTDSYRPEERCGVQYGLYLRVGQRRG